VDIEVHIRKGPPDGCAQRRPHCEVWDKVPIHHIQVEQIGALVQDQLAVLAKPREVCGKNRRRNQWSLGGLASTFLGALGDCTGVILKLVRRLLMKRFGNFGSEMVRPIW